jgi:putative ABC transport system permease protein
VNVTSNIKLSFKALGKNRFRTVLTMLGLIIGVAAVISMQAIGKGSSSDINKRISSLGSNLIVIMPAAAREAGVRMESGTASVLKKEDADELIKKVPELKAVSPLVRVAQQVKYGNENWRTSVQGVYPGYFFIRDFELTYGTSFSEEDEKRLVKVCVIGKTVADNLFGENVNVIGKTIRIGSVPFLVTGLLKSKGSGFGQDQDDVILAPFSTVQRRMLGTDRIQQIFASAASEDVVNDAVNGITETLREKHKLLESQDDDFTIGTQSEIRQTLNQVIGTITLLLAIIAAIPLVVGGIGVMNIMLVSVTERTREIGIRMAVGATPVDVQFQMLIEAIVLTLAGGLIGIGLGVGAALLLTSIAGWTTLITIQSIVIAFVVSSLIGIFFGWYPALKAARLNPIDALRYE